MSFFERLHAAEPDSLDRPPLAKSRWFAAVAAAGDSADWEFVGDETPPHSVAGGTFSSRFATPDTFASETPATPALAALEARQQELLQRAAALEKKNAAIELVPSSPTRTASTAAASFDPAELSAPVRSRGNSGSTLADTVVHHDDEDDLNATALAEQLEALDVVPMIAMQRSSPMAVPNLGRPSKRSVPLPSETPGMVSASMVDALLAARNHANVEVGTSRHYSTALAAYDSSDDDALSGRGSTSASSVGDWHSADLESSERSNSDTEDDDEDGGVFDFDF